MGIRGVHDEIEIQANYLMTKARGTIEMRGRVSRGLRQQSVDSVDLARIERLSVSCIDVLLSAINQNWTSENGT